MSETNQASVDGCELASIQRCPGQGAQRRGTPVTRSRNKEKPRHLSGFFFLEVFEFFRRFAFEKILFSVRTAKGD